MRRLLPNGKYTCWYGTCLAEAVVAPELYGISYIQFMVCTSSRHKDRVEQILYLTYEINRMMSEEDNDPNPPPAN